MKQKAEKTDKITINIPVKLKRKLKFFAWKNETTLTDIIVRLVKKELDDAGVDEEIPKKFCPA